MDHGRHETLLEDEPRFAGGSETPLACAHLSLIFDKAIGAYLLSCDDEDGEGLRLIVEPTELEVIARHLLAARAWSGTVGIHLAPLSVRSGSMEAKPPTLAPAAVWCPLLAADRDFSGRMMTAAHTEPQPA